MARAHWKDPDRSGSRAGERIVAAAGLGAAAILSVAAWVGGGDPESSARASLERLAEAGAAAVGAAWVRLASEDEPAPALGERVSWRVDDPLGVLDAPPRDEDVDVDGNGEATAEFLALLGAAQRAELVEGDPERALADLEELSGRAGGGAVPRARALSRAVRLAASLGHLERAAGSFALARAELVGDEHDEVGGAPVSALLLAGLGLAPHLAEEPRAELGAWLAERWSAGAFVLPGGDPLAELGAEPPRLVLREDPLRAALFERLAALGPRAAEVLATRTRARRARALAAAGVELDLDADGLWRWVPSSPGELALRAMPDGRREARLVERSALERAWLQRVEGQGLLPAGLAIELEGGPVPSGERLREPATLPGAPFRFALRHADAGAVLVAERRRAALLRGGLLAAALAVGAASLVAARALARGRRLVELRSRFVASVTHELRTPLASILMLAENLEQGRAADPERRGRYPALIRREAERLARLVDDVLDVARLEQGARPRVEREIWELAALPGELRAELEPLAARAGGALGLAAQDLPERASFDREALGRAARNLVQNALVHGGVENGPIEVALSVADGRLRLAVRDHGRGLGAAQRAAAFAPFERLGSAAPGAGLGLWIVRELARAHGGDAWFESPASGPGVVAVFEIELGSGADREPAGRANGREST